MNSRGVFYNSSNWDGSVTYPKFAVATGDKRARARARGRSPRSNGHTYAVAGGVTIQLRHEKAQPFLCSRVPGGGHFRHRELRTALTRRAQACPQ